MESEPRAVATGRNLPVVHHRNHETRSLPLPVLTLLSHHMFS
jgi:hypothetical protein